MVIYLFIYSFLHSSTHSGMNNFEIVTIHLYLSGILDEGVTNMLLSLYVVVGALNCTFVSLTILFKGHLYRVSLRGMCQTSGECSLH